MRAGRNLAGDKIVAGFRLQASGFGQSEQSCPGARSLKPEAWSLYKTRARWVYPSRAPAGRRRDLQPAVPTSHGLCPDIPQSPRLVGTVPFRRAPRAESVMRSNHQHKIFSGGRITDYGTGVPMSI